MGILQYILFLSDGHVSIHSTKFTEHSLSADTFLVADSTAGNYTDGVPAFTVLTLQGKEHNIHNA